MLHSSIRAAIVLLALAGAGQAQAVQVYYTVQNLGGNRWLYAYRLDAFPYSGGYGFSVFFDPALHAAISTAAPAPGSDWDALVVQPDPALGADGFYDAEALYDDATIAAVFRVSFDWLGAGTPGDQVFEVREPAPSFAAVESGTTRAPEPTPWVQAATAVLALAARRSRRC